MQSNRQIVEHLQSLNHKEKKNEKMKKKIEKSYF